MPHGVMRAIAYSALALRNQHLPVRGVLLPQCGFQ